jgi:hypothetical protein
MDEGESDAGLCGQCRYVKVIWSQKGSVFYLCRKSETDGRFEKYPRLPVRVCGGYEREEGV